MIGVPESVVASKAVRDDGLVPFLAPQPGITPTVAAHLTTKAYVDAAIAAAIAALPPATGQLPIGYILHTKVATNPGTGLGYGTWVALAPGRVLVGIDSGDPDFDAVGDSPGAKTVAAAGTVAAPTVSGSTGGESGHTHDVTVIGADFAAEGETALYLPVQGDVTSSAGTGHTHTAGSLAASAPAFTGSATSVVQPSYVVYIWERTA